MMTASARRRRQLATLAVIIIMLSAGAAPAVASPLRQLASGTVAFASDGTRFVAWQTAGDEQIVVLDTLTGLRQQITPPAGCKLHDEAEDGEPVIGAAAGRFLLSVMKELHRRCTTYGRARAFCCRKRPTGPLTGTAWALAT